MVAESFVDSSNSGALHVEDAWLPLSFAQDRLWFLAQMDGGSEAYHIPAGVRLKGALNGSVLRRALDRIVFRHEVLRTTFARLNGKPVQRISPAAGSRFLLAEHDLRGREDAQTELHRLSALERSAPFNLEAGPLIRGRLIHLGENDHALLITMHHIVFDGWSMGVLVNELNALYKAFLHGEGDPLPELEIQYGDYAVWQRQEVESGNLQRQAAYWKETLAGAPPVIELPTDHPRPLRQNYSGAVVEFELPEGHTAELKAFSRKHESTLFMTLLSAWGILLSRLSGQRDLVIGTAAANRGSAQVENLIGFFVNTLALRLNVPGSSTVSQLLQHVKKQALEAQGNQDIPFEQVVESSNPVRSTSHTPLFQVMFAWQTAPARSLQLHGLEASPLELAPHRIAILDLSLSLWESGDAIAGRLEYATSLFERESVERYTTYFRNLLSAITADDRRCIDCLRMLPESERKQLVYDWNGPRADFPGDLCVHELFEQQALKTPDAIALVYQDGHITYAGLNARANRLAHYLRELGVRPDSKVAICAERGLELVVALLGVLKAGGAYVPLDPEYPAERLQFMLENSEPVALLTQAHLQTLFPRAGRLPILDLTDANAPWHTRSSAHSSPGSSGLSPADLAYVIYTSGSTGQPKGVAIEHRGLLNRLAWAQSVYGLTREDAVLQKTPASFDVSVWEFFWPLLTGARLVIAKPGGHKDPGYLVNAIGQNNITILHFVPSMLQAFLDYGRAGRCSTLRHVLCSGEALAPALVRRLQEQLPNTAVHNLYGPTEASIDVTACACTPAHQSKSSMPIGSPVANTKIHVLHTQDEPVPAGVTGELYIGGVQLARGYLNRPGLTAERFLPDPLGGTPGARLYRTSDLGRWLRDGNIEFLGRNDFQIKLRGFRIELGEIEARMVEHPAIGEAVVVAREDTGGDKRVVAYYTCAPDEKRGPARPGGEEEFRRHLAARLPEYMIPSAYVRLKALPLTASGKIDRKALPAPEAEPSAAPEHEAPQGEVEAALAAIWMEVLKIKHVGRHDNFFELGGHSLSMIQVASRMKAALGVDVPLATCFDGPTVVEMSIAVAVAAAELAGEYPDDLLQEIDDLCQMSPEQVGALLQEEGR